MSATGSGEGAGPSETLDWTDEEPEGPVPSETVDWTGQEPGAAEQPINVPSAARSDAAEAVTPARSAAAPSTVVRQVNWAQQEPREAALAAIERPRGGPTVEQFRETTRSRLAVWLMALTTATVLSILLIGGLQLAGALSHKGPTITDLADSLLTPVITITGTALGFYYGAQTAADSSDAQKSAAAGDWPRTEEPGLVRRVWRWFW